MELLLQINSVSDSETDFQDGDVVDAISVSRIRLSWAAFLCHPKKFAMNDVTGLRELGTACEQYLSVISRYKFTRLSDNTVSRLNFETGETKEFSDQADENGERIDVQPYLNKITQHKHHKVFGTPGSEVWYSQIKTDVSHSVVWDTVESALQINRDDYSSWMFTPLEKIMFLPVKVSSNSEVSDPTANERREHHAVAIDSDDDEPAESIVMRRKYNIPYWDLANDFGISVDDVRSTKPVDARGATPHMDSVINAKDLSAWQL